MLRSLIPARVGGQSAHKARTGRILALVAVALFVAVFSGGSLAAKAKPAKPLPVPKLVLNAALNGNSVAITGGFRLKNTLLPTALRWTEQEFDASNNPLPLTTAGYSVTPVPTPTQPVDPNTQVLQTTAFGATRLVRQRIPGANRMTVIVTASVPASKTHRSAKAKRSFSFNLGGYTAVGTTIPRLAFTPIIFTSPFVGWDKSPLSTPDTSPTVSLPSPWQIASQFGQLTACWWVGRSSEAPTDPLPNRDEIQPGTGLANYGIQLLCNDPSNPHGPKYRAISSITVDFEYSNDPSNQCEFTMEGVQSFTLPPTWMGFISFYVNLITYRPDSSVENSGNSIQTHFGWRTQGTVNVCQAFNPPLPRLHP